jgi:hypothetical protein
MKKLIFTFFASISLIGFLKAQVITDFETTSAPTSITTWGGTTPTLGTDPASSSNNVLVIQRDSGYIWNQTTIIKVPAVTITTGNTSLKVRIKGPAGAYIYIKLWNSSTGKEIGESWVNNADGSDTTKGASVWVDLHNTTLLSGGETIDSIMINIGTWAGTVETKLNGAYYIDSISAYAPTSSIVYMPHSLVTKFAHAIYLEDDSISFDGTADENTWSDGNVYNINDGSSDTTFGTATFIPAYDDNYIYFFINVKKPTPTKYDEVSGNAWKQDGSQIYFDVYNKLIVEGIAKNQFQLTLPLSAKFYKDFSPYAGNSVSPGDSIFTPADTTKDRQSGVYGYHKDIIVGTTKYQQEIRVPIASLYWNNKTVTTYAQALAAFNADPRKAGDTLGFEIQVNMWNATTSARDGVNTWAQASDTGITVNGTYYSNSLGSYQNSGQWGGLILDPTGSSAVKTITDNSGISVYPNPAKSVVKISGKNINSFEVYSVTGAKVYSQVVTSDVTSLNVSSFAKGVYILKIYGTSGTSTKKLIVQ